MATNCYIVADMLTHEAVIIDPGDDAEYVIEHLSELGSTPQLILATHGHFDHILAAYAIQVSYNIPFVLHKSDTFLVEHASESARYYLKLGHVDPPPAITRTVSDGDVLKFGNHSLVIMHTPGHTPGSISIYISRANALFVGDTIFADGSFGRTDFSYSDSADITRSVRKIFLLPNTTKLYAGHGNSTTIKSVRLGYTV